MKNGTFYEKMGQLLATNVCSSLFKWKKLIQNNLLLIVFSNTKHHKRSIFFSKMSFQGELMPNESETRK